MARSEPRRAQRGAVRRARRRRRRAGRAAGGGSGLIPPGDLPARSYLYAPAHRPEVLARAVVADADVVVADLEDGVPAAAKDAARANVLAFLAEAPPGRVHVRVNPVGSELGRRDLRALAAAAPVTIRVPKVESPEDVRVAVRLLEAMGGSARLSCLIESAVGVEDAYAIATAHPWVAAIGLGEADLASDLGVRVEEGLEYVRSRVVVAARAASLPAPAQSVYTTLRDDDGLRRTTVAARDRGFFGRSVIHPSQVAIVNEVFSPTESEISEARAILAAIGADGTAVLPDGRFVDRAMVAAAERIVRWDSRAEERAASR